MKLCPTCFERVERLARSHDPLLQLCNCPLPALENLTGFVVRCVDTPGDFALRDRVQPDGREAFDGLGLLLTVAGNGFRRGLQLTIQPFELAPRGAQRGTQVIERLPPRQHRYHSVIVAPPVGTRNVGSR